MTTQIEKWAEEYLQENHDTLHHRMIEEEKTRRNIYLAGARKVREWARENEYIGTDETGKGTRLGTVSLECLDRLFEEEREK